MKRNSYTLEDKQRALELAKKTNVRAAAYFLNIPYSTVYNWTLATEPPTNMANNMELFTPSVEVVEDDEKRDSKLIDAIRDLTSAVELLTETMLDTAERKLNVVERRA